VVLYYCTRKQYGRVAPLPLTATPMHLRGGLPVPCSHLSRALCPVRVSIHAIWDCLPSTTTAGRSWLWLAGVSPQPSGIINSSPLVDRSRAARTEDLALSPRAAGKKIKKAPGACICNGHRSSLPVASPPADERDAHETKKNKKAPPPRSRSTISSRPGRFTARGSPARSRFSHSGHLSLVSKFG
jgi:hypothetical protein